MKFCSWHIKCVKLFLWSVLLFWSRWGVIVSRCTVCLCWNEVCLLFNIHCGWWWMSRNLTLMVVVDCSEWLLSVIHRDRYSTLCVCVFSAVRVSFTEKSVLEVCLKVKMFAGSLSQCYQDQSWAWTLQKAHADVARFDNGLLMPP